jgi:hypothetical protein
VSCSSVYFFRGWVELTFAFCTTLQSPLSARTSLRRVGGGQGRSASSCPRLASSHLVLVSSTWLQRWRLPPAPTLTWPTTSKRYAAVAHYTVSPAAQAYPPLLVALLQVDQLFRHDKAAQQVITNTRPWRTDPHHFKKVRISAVALIKMVRCRPAVPCTSLGCTNAGCFATGDARSLWWTVRDHGVDAGE